MRFSRKSVSETRHDDPALQLLRLADYTKVRGQVGNILLRELREVTILVVVEEKKTAEVRAMIETYNKEVSFIDYESLTQIVELV